MEVKDFLKISDTQRILQRLSNFAFANKVKLIFFVEWTKIWFYFDNIKE